MLPRCKTTLTLFAIACLAAASPTLAETITSKFQDISEGPYAPTKSQETSIGKRIAYWAEAFIGTPYDTDPLGKYVREERIVADDAVDCMYLTFRAVELAISKTPEEAIEKALNLRFTTRGRLDGERVVNYNERFEYGEDMIDSGKLGKEITSELGRTEKVKGSRGRDEVVIIPKDEFLRISRGSVKGTVPDLRTTRSGVVESGLSPLEALQDGDIIFFIKPPEKRVVGEIVGHIGIVAIEEGVPFLIHASGTKKSNTSNGGGIVKSVKLSEYLEKMRFAGVRVTRFQ